MGIMSDLHDYKILCSNKLMILGLFHSSLYIADGPSTDVCIIESG